MAQNTMIATKISTKTKVAVGIALVAGSLIVANALIRFNTTTSTTLSKTTLVKESTIYVPTPTTTPAFLAATLPPGNLGYGLIRLNRVRINVPPGNGASLAGLAFKMTLNVPTGISIQSLELRVADSATKVGNAAIYGAATCGFTAASANELCVRAWFASPAAIAGGTSKSYDLYAYFVGTNSYLFKSGHSVSTQVLGEASQLYGSLSGSGSPDFGINGTRQNQAFADGSGTWWNGGYAYGLPTAVQTVSKP